MISAQYFVPSQIQLSVEEKIKTFRHSRTLKVFLWIITGGDTLGNWGSKLKDSEHTGSNDMGEQYVEISGCSASPEEQPGQIWTRRKGAPGRRSLERKTKRPMIEKGEGVSYKKKKKGNYIHIPFQIKACV